MDQPGECDSVIDQEFEGPLFKRLSHNDSGAAAGNQAGFLVPKRFRYFFPPLPDPTDAEPAPHRPLDAILILDNNAPVSVTTSWQYQSWKNTRKPESRLTGQLEAIRKPSAEGDLLLIERGLIDPLQYRLTVLRKGTPLFAAADPLTGGKSAGFLPGAGPQVSDGDVMEAEAEIAAATAAPFEPFENDAPMQTQVKRIARARAFRDRVIAAYDGRCAVCGGGIRLPGGASELEAAHVIPRAQKGADDVRNGLALCRAHHWAFDHQLIGITVGGTIKLAPGVSTLPENAGLAGFDGKPFATPANVTDALHDLAVKWSVEQFILRWHS